MQNLSKDVILRKASEAILTHDGKTKKEVNLLLENLQKSEALVNEMKPISLEIYAKAIAIHKPKKTRSERKKVEEQELIVNPDELYLTDDKTSELIYKYHRDGLKEKGYQQKSDYCPMLVAESEKSNCEREIIQFMCKNILDNDGNFINTARHRGMIPIFKELVTKLKR